MSDVLLDLGRKSWFRQTVRTLGLPLPMPQPLRRAEGAWSARPLENRRVVVAAAPSPSLLGQVADVLAAAGATAHLFGEALDEVPFREAGEAYGRPPVRVAAGDVAAAELVEGLVFDATGCAGPEDLQHLYEGFHPWLRRLDTCAHMVVLARPLTSRVAAPAAAASRAIEGFVRSLAKEVGRRGATVNAVYVDKGAEKRAVPLLRFLLSDRAAFLTGQALHVGKRVSAPGALPMTRPLDRKVALVTGAARGIGAATAAALAAEGAHVVCLDRPGDDGHLARVAREIGGSLFLADMTSRDTPERLARHLLEDQGGVDIVVHNAGVTRDKTLARMKPSFWEQAIEVNLASVIRVTERLEEDVLRDHGRVVCLASVAGIAGNFGQTNYAASKAGIIGFVQAKAAGYAKRGIAINAVAPGFIETRLTAAIPTVQREVGRRLSALGQGGLPRDVADLITFLSTPGAYGLSGQVIRICGGMFVGA